jgi:nitroreductase
MDAYTALITRRSIRKYTDAPIPEETIERILRAAMFAPSAVNKQPWHFVIIDDRASLQSIPGFHKNAQMAASAPCAILVCGDIELVIGPRLLPQDCAAATENLLLAAHIEGLGAVWCGVHPQEDREAGFREMLSLPANIVPFALVVLGYPAEEPNQPDRYQPDRIHRNGW